MSMKCRLPKDVVAGVHKSILDGLTQRETADLWHVSLSTVSRIVANNKKKNVSAPKHAPTNITPSHIEEEVVRDLKAGVFKQSDIAKRHRLSPPTITRIKRDYGLMKRKRSRQRTSSTRRDTKPGAAKLNGHAPLKIQEITSNGIRLTVAILDVSFVDPYER